MAVDVQMACSDAGIPDVQEIQSWVEFAVGQSKRIPAANTDVAVRIVDADEIRTLNKLYRNKDVSTNVLSFPAGDIAGLPAESARELGDIVICASVVSDEASQQGKVLADHWAHMLVHGALHLLGYDHEESAEAEEMEHLEMAILKSRGIANPYASAE